MTCCSVPEKSGLSLVGDSDSLNVLPSVAHGFELLDGSFDAFVDRVEKVEGFVFVPAVRYREEEEEGRESDRDLFDGTREPR